MNWRALGCAVLAAAVFVAIGILGLQLALGRPGCPQNLVWADRIYVALGDPTAQPVVGDGEPVRLGTTLVGALSRAVYGPEGSAPSPSAADRPAEIALDCGDGTFVSYRYRPEPTPSDQASAAPVRRSSSAWAYRSVIPDT